IARAGCCGALRQHLDAPEAALDDARRNIDAWWPEIEAGAEAVVVTASGCGVQVRDYGYLLRGDPLYAGKAARVSALCRDPSEVLAMEAADLRPLLAKRHAERGALAFHSPCSLQHGLNIRGVVERLLTDAGYTLTPVAESHLCCGSAGTYSFLQPELSQQLKARKQAALMRGRPAGIATANIGCLTHLQAGSRVPIRHWIELIDDILRE
ncbi:MAG: heterodisulfide reductase-related iron-sulfur binding cluster, partial [Betaproteobacteria bacterium]